MAAYRTLWLSTCVPLGVMGAVVALGASPAAVACLVVGFGVIGTLLTVCWARALGETGTACGRWIRSVRAPSASQLDAVLRALAYASPESAQFQPPPERVLTDEQLCMRWRASYRASRRRVSAVKLLADAAERQVYLDELEHRNASGFAAWLAAGPEAAEDPLPYLTGHHAPAPAVDWDELTRGQG